MEYLSILAVSASINHGLLGAILAFGAANANIDSQNLADSTTIELGIEGYIKPRCVIQIDTPQSHLTLTGQDGRYTQSFDVDCNQHLSVEMRSLNGALLHTKSELQSPDAEFSDRINYQVDFSVAAPGASVVSARSQDMFDNSVSGSIGTIPYKTEGNLHFSWSSDKPLLSGEYGDVIEIRVIGDGGMGRRS